MLWLLLLGCPGPVDDTASDCFTDPPAVEVGTGEATFTAFDEAAEVTMVHGPQGGWHLLGSARVSHTSDFVRIHFTVSDTASAAVVADNAYTVALVRDETCSGYFPGMYAFIDVSELIDGELDTPPELLDGHELQMTMDITDDADRTASATHTVTAVRDPADEPSL